MGSLAISRGVAPSVRGQSGLDPNLPLAPSAQTDPATNVTWLGATLNGQAQNYDQACTVQFQYGTTANYGKVTQPFVLAASGVNQAVSASIVGFAPSTTYHARLRAFNAFGTSYGVDITFTTTAVGGAVPTVLGTPPVVVALGVADLTSTSASLKGTVAAGSPGSPIGQPTTGRMGLRRKGVGASFIYYNGQTITTSSLTPVSIPDTDGVQATGLLPDTDYEIVSEGKNIKSEPNWIQSTPYSFHTPALPPPPGVPPTCNTVSASGISSTQIGGNVQVSHNNADPLTGFTDIYVRYVKTSDLGGSEATTPWTQIGPLNFPGTVNGTANLTFSYQISGLTPTTNYTVWAFASNNYGTASDFVTPNAASTGSTALGTISTNIDSAWWAYNQVTMRCKYTTPAAGTFQIRFGYRESALGGAFTYTTYDSVAISTTQADWDGVASGLKPATAYDFLPELYDGASTVAADVAGYFTTAAAPSGINSTAPNYPGIGPGSRGGPTGQAGSPPTIQGIPTYADPRRPSSGLVSKTNLRKFISNISANPTLGPGNKTRFSSASDAAFTAADGADIIVYGAGHGVTLTYPGNSWAAGQTPQNYDIEIWDPEICKALGTTTAPHVIRAGSTTNATTHNAGNSAHGYALTRFARWGDVVATIGTLSTLEFCRVTSSPANVWWQKPGSTTVYSAIVGVSILGLTAKTHARVFTFAVSGACKYSSSAGCITNVHIKNVKVNCPASNANAPFRHGSPNTGSNDPLIGYTLNSFGGLMGIYSLNGVSLNGADSWLRFQSSNYRYDLNDWDCDFADEHVIYPDNPSAHICGDENGVAAPSFFRGLRNRAGLIYTIPNGDGRNSLHNAARFMDNNPASVYKCSANCVATDCANGISIGPSGEGTLYFKDCDLVTGTQSQPLSKQIGTIALYGHQGRIEIENCRGNCALCFLADNSCQHILRPVYGPDGNVYAFNDVEILSYEMTGNDCGQGSITLDSIRKVVVHMPGIVINTALASGRFPIEIASDATQDTFKAPGSTTVNYIRPCGFVQLIGISTWTPPTSGKKVRFAKNGGPHNNNPPMIDTVYSTAELAVFETGVCRAYLQAPLTQPGSFVCSNS